MKKILIVFGIVLAAYLIAAVVAWRFLPERLADAERRCQEARVSIQRLQHDQGVVSERVRMLSKETLGKGKSKVDEVLAFLQDPDLNRVARTYRGSDWSQQASVFLGQVSHVRKQVSEQIQQLKDAKNLFKEKISKLERRKVILAKKLTSGMNSDVANWRAELANVERQLTTLRSSGSGSDKIDDRRCQEVVAHSETELHKLASDYQQTTLGALDDHFAAQLSLLQWEVGEPERLRWVAQLFDVWPLNLVVKVPKEEDREK